MMFTEQLENELKILYNELKGVATAAQVGVEFEKKHGRKVGNIYDDMKTICLLGFAEKDIVSKNYSVTEKGRKRLGVLFKDEPRLDLLYNGIVIEKVKMDEVLFLAIVNEAKKEGQSVEEWVLGVLRMAAEVDEQGSIGDSQKA